MNTTHTPTIEESLRQIEAALTGLGSESAVGDIRAHLENIRKRIADPVHLVIDNFGGVLQDIAAFETDAQAEEHFKAMTDLSYEEVRKWEDADRSYSIGLSDKFDMQIWQVEVRRRA